MSSRRLPVFVGICSGLNTNNIGISHTDDHTISRRYRKRSSAIEDFQPPAMADDYDSFQPCFYDESGMDFEMEFYDAPVHSDDIWKKFELLPTPPRSPKHEAFASYAVTYGTPSVEEKLQIVSALLDDDPISRTILTPHLECSCGNLKSKVIKDCMWSEPGAAQLAESFSGYCHAKSEKVSCETPRKSGLAATTVCGTPTGASAETHEVQPSSNNPQSLLLAKVARSIVNTPCHSGIGSSSPTKTRSESESSTSSTLDMEAAECVSPSAVFPYNSLADPRTHALDTPSPSESSEDEEIDVVTVADKITLTRRKPILPASVSMKAQVAALHNYSSSASPPQKTATLAVQRSAQPARNTTGSVVSVIRKPYGSKTSSPSTTHNSGRHSGHRKRDRDNGVAMEAVSVSLLHKLNRDAGVHKSVHGYSRPHHHGSRSGGSRPSSKPSSRSSSDSEDTDRRAAHNDLERKRRDDLRYSFVRLRDTVPTLKTSERAAKVVILQKATDYIASLNSKEKSLLKEKTKQQELHDYLTQKLAKLRRTIY